MSESKARVAAAARQSPFKQLGEILYKPVVFHYAIIWLIVLLVAGTIAQRTIGLHMAQEKYFSSWLVWFGWIPAPGGRLTMLAIFINLFTKTVFKSIWRLDQIGVLISHFGALMLLGGGFVTAYTSVEGSMAVVEGDQSAVFSSYHYLEFAVIETTDPGFDKVLAFSGPYVAKGAVIEHEDIPFSIRVKEFHRNADVVRLENSPGDNYRAAAKRFGLAPLKLETENERNQGGALIELSGLDDASNGVYLLVEFMSVPQTLTLSDGRSFRLELRRRTYPLPFTIEVIDFKKEVHPNTEVARAYSSKVNVIENGVPRQVMIEMNKPLRSQGYTLYQSSFVEGDADTTILAVVKNRGRLFPYISSIIICIGVLIHMGFQLPRLIKRVNA
jgi:hypothetical protein